MAAEDDPDTTKLFTLSSEGVWTEIGIGTALIDNSNSQVPRLRIESTLHGEVLLDTPLSPDDIYLVQQDLVLVWNDPQLGKDMALSFRSPTLCSQFVSQIALFQSACRTSRANTVLLEHKDSSGNMDMQSPWSVCRENLPALVLALQDNTQRFAIHVMRYHMQGHGGGDENQRNPTFYDEVVALWRGLRNLEPPDLVGMRHIGNLTFRLLQPPFSAEQQIVAQLGHDDVIQDTIDIVQFILVENQMINPVQASKFLSRDQRLAMCHPDPRFPQELNTKIAYLYSLTYLKDLLPGSLEDGEMGSGMIGSYATRLRSMITEEILRNHKGLFVEILENLKNEASKSPEAAATPAAGSSSLPDEGNGTSDYSISTGRPSTSTSDSAAAASATHPQDHPLHLSPIGRNITPAEAELVRVLSLLHEITTNVRVILGPIEPKEDLLRSIIDDKGIPFISYAFHYSVQKGLASEASFAASAGASVSPSPGRQSVGFGASPGRSSVAGTGRGTRRRLQPGAHDWYLEAQKCADILCHLSLYAPIATRNALLLEAATAATSSSSHPTSLHANGPAMMRSPLLTQGSSASDAHLTPSGPTRSFIVPLGSSDHTNGKSMEGGGTSAAHAGGSTASWPHPPLLAQLIPVLAMVSDTVLLQSVHDALLSLTFGVAPQQQTLTLALHGPLEAESTLTAILSYWTTGKSPSMTTGPIAHPPAQLIGGTPTTAVVSTDFSRLTSSTVSTDRASSTARSDGISPLSVLYECLRRVSQPKDEKAANGRLSACESSEQSAYHILRLLATFVSSSVAEYPVPASKMAKTLVAHSIAEGGVVKSVANLIAAYVAPAAAASPGSVHRPSSRLVAQACGFLGAVLAAGSAELNKAVIDSDALGPIVVALSGQVSWGGSTLLHKYSPAFGHNVLDSALRNVIDAYLKSAEDATELIGAPGTRPSLGRHMRGIHSFRRTAPDHQLRLITEQKEKARVSTMIGRYLREKHALEFSVGTPALDTSTSSLNGTSAQLDQLSTDASESKKSPVMQRFGQRLSRLLQHADSILTNDGLTSGAASTVISPKRGASQISTMEDEYDKMLASFASTDHDDVSLLGGQPDDPLLRQSSFRLRKRSHDDLTGDDLNLGESFNGNGGSDSAGTYYPPPPPLPAARSTSRSQADDDEDAPFLKRQRSEE